MSTGSDGIRRDTIAIGNLSAVSLFRLLIRLAKQTERNSSATKTMTATIMAVIQAGDSKEKKETKVKQAELSEARDRFHVALKR